MGIELRRPLTICAVAFLAALVWMPAIGSTHLDLGRVWSRQEPEYGLFVFFRLPRVLVSLLAGGCLAFSGALFQTMLRDALATPYTLGVSSGAALGAVAMLTLNLPGLWAGAFAGAGAVLALVLGIATEGRRVSSFTLLLAGVAINSLCGSIILFLHYTAGSLAQSFSISRWLMGGIEPLDYGPLALFAVVALSACLVVTAYARQWNSLAFGEEWAAARGVDAQRLVLIGYVAGSLLTGLITAITGPIGFVGLIVPHALRLCWGPDLRVILPCSFLVGGAFLAVCDTAARTVLAPAEMPVGVITALLGAPFFIWLLRNRRKTFWL
jgi:iron complex transport system permease protein